MTKTKDEEGIVVELEVEAEVGTAIDEVLPTVTRAVEICLVEMIPVADDGIPPALTIVYTGFVDAVTDEEEARTVFAKSKVTLTRIVFAGSDSLTTAVDMTVSVDPGSVTAGAVIVWVKSEV